MPKIALTSKADSDLEGIYEHYEPRLGAEKAEEVIFQVLEAITRLETFPQLGKASDIPDCRELIISKYPYRSIYTRKGDTILIYRILHQHAERPDDW
ncbi:MULTISPECIES: type II toxin-antitoxin system RelE/ParE family toxin [Pseudomonas]|uniref:Type II toxin-antitoxin system mRNA interferase toxin, RelE/StbE family n=1 Tax=Pseudomonas helleri TaxID=1608996 RepID=A0A6A7Z0I8_9PSED|nr:MULTISPECIES: type II toxin-antitoxin system RelE/ParE family toxin [Pseudomonas]MBO5391994.1 type II toxin-antitoxin system RelE/ParE family toxin [Pseudomonas sp.]MEC4170403.1 type II toxin-antitoxin system RelE/ParE family toxin [Pseudomonas sp. MS-1(2024)]MQT82811.1 type II toxin-antitoxin system mRNA interferase toxin, RelE/StbE family [Pseudomonas helleri]